MVIILRQVIAIFDELSLFTNLTALMCFSWLSFFCLAFYKDLRIVGFNGSRHGPFLMLALSTLPALVVFWLHGYVDDVVTYKLVAVTIVIFGTVRNVNIATRYRAHHPRSNWVYAIDECLFQCLGNKAT